MHDVSVGDIRVNVRWSDPVLNETIPYKLLYIAYCCEPGRGSEWGLGWSYVQEMSRTQPVWVIAHDDSRVALETYLRERHTQFPVRVTYVKLPKLIAWMRNSWYSLFNVHYYLWQYAAARAAVRLHEQEGLDLVQHVSLCRWWMPSAGMALASRGVGFIFGPVGGGEIMPRKFRNRSPILAKVGDMLRLIGRTLCRHDPILVRCMRSADLLLAAIPPAEKWLRGYGNPNVDTVCTGSCSSPDVLEAASIARASRPKDAPFTFGSCGGLSYFRGVDLAVRAFAKANIPNSRYIHSCNGPMRPALEKLARDLGVADRVEFLGDIGHVESVKALAQADAVVHTVLRDSEGIIPDMLHAGVPAITLDHLTPAMLVPADAGHRIPIDDDTTPEDVVNELADVMRTWYENPTLLAEKSIGAQRRGRELTPLAKGEHYRAYHRRVLAMVRDRKAAALSYAPVTADAKPRAV